MIFAINNALIATRNKAASITSAGDFVRIFLTYMFAFHLYFLQTSRHSNAMSIAPSRGGVVVLTPSLAIVEPVPMGGMISIIY
jgi:hypothetical protein